MTTATALRTDSDPLERLNPAQRAAVVHGGGGVAGPLLVIAGAGTGKTHTLVHRLAHLVRSGADPRRILLMTFSRRAAAEMVRRAERLAVETMGPTAEVLARGLTWAGTFHAMGARLLREYAPAIGLDPGFTIHDREDSADLMALARHRLGVAGGPRRFPAKSTCLAIYSRAVNARAPLDEVLRDAFPWCAEWHGELKSLFATYVEAKQASAVLDYDDLLLYWHGLMQEAGLAAEIGGRFDHVLVDEYQDTNRLQSGILLALRPNGDGLTVVGDDAQSIYAFRAAEVRNILDFPDAFSPRATVVTLEQNYRSTPEILAAANAVIGEATEGFRKELRSDRPAGPRPRLATVWDEACQVDLICRDVLAAREEGLALREQAVLFRTAHHSGPLEVELVRRNIPFVKFGGLKFLDAAHVKDVLATLRLVQNPRDRVSGFRVLQLIPGIGAATATTVLDTLADAADPDEALSAVRVPARANAQWQEFVALFRQVRPGKLGWPGELEAVRQWYEPHLERRHDDAAPRRADLLQLEAIAAGFGDRTRFLTEITLDPPSATSDESGPPHRDEDYLILSTIHSAKGQEWRRVHVLNGVDGCIPSDLATGTSAEINEERRLFYVAMTRARDELTVIVPQRFYVHGQSKRGDRHVYASRTRFIPDRLLGHFEVARIPVATATAAPALATGATVDLASRMRAMWG
ncbi:DNA helicase-2/ATP-dependent DNA helicase PcrA [Amaricoccus macauensis]|uniref:DNA 3'-5' helicase n=1 Tax=Amaricoccus macauensis TaxID=57001 RepID=A0A840SQR1_9RHOB|nr:ATP-dependent helicase [Amaricoccus macauensis]MBB5221591.1 DNA helicase-2/ATP-dependent DNA helicase PcrA [Amaricoccus macauensis]